MFADYLPCLIETFTKPKVRLGTSLGLFMLLNMFLVGYTSAQTGGSYIIKGQVGDSITGEPLPFVNLVVVGTQKGTSTDLSGNFTLTVPADAQKLKVSFIGYRTKELVVTPLLKVMRIRLGQAAVVKQEIVVNSKANPAHRIIRLAVANKSKNNPENITSFSYQSHNKLIIGPDLTKGTPVEEKRKKKDLPDSLPNGAKVIKDSAYYARKARRVKADSAEGVEMQRFLDTSYIFLNETFSERKYRFPGQSNEKVLATRTSGFPALSLAALGTKLQPFGFYKDAITLYNRDYVNPVSAGSTRRYDFTLVQTRINNPGDTTFVIEYEPYPDANIVGLKGQLSINSRGYAIENITASSADKFTLINFNLKQMYEWVDGKYWFPTQLHTDIQFPKSSSIDAGGYTYPIAAMMRTFLGKIKTDAGISRLEFIEEELEIPSAAIEPDLTYLKQLRIDTSSYKEDNTYKLLDRMVRDSAQGVDKFVYGLEYLAYGAIPWGKFEVPFKHWFGLNRVEGFRLGFGLRTSHKLSEWYTLEAYGAYGTRDGKFKYGLSADARLSRYFDWHIGGSYSYDVVEPGRERFFNQSDLLSTESYRDLIASRMNYVQSRRVYTRFRPFKYTGIEIAADQRNWSPSYDYQFQPVADDGTLGNPLSAFNTFEIQAATSIVLGERYELIKGRRLMLERGYPALYVQAARGMQNVPWATNIGDLNYNRLSARLELHYKSIFLGNTYITFQGGVTDRPLPYALLFNALGSRDPEIPVVMRNNFQTVGLYEFTHDHFGAAFFYHDFGSLLWKSPYEKFSPKPVITHASGWGSLRSPFQQQGVETSTMLQGLHESGLFVKDLYRINYLNAYYLGLGLGVFHRWGPLQLPKASDNWVWKFDIEISF